MLGLRFCARAFSSCGERGPLFIAVRGPYTVAASPLVEHRLQTRRFSSCGSQAQLLCGMWDLPGLGHEPMSPALAGGFRTTAPPGKPCTIVSWLFLPCLHIPSLPWLAAVWTCPLELREGDTERFLFSGAPQGPAQFQEGVRPGSYT